MDVKYGGGGVDGKEAVLRNRGNKRERQGNKMKDLERDLPMMVMGSNL